MAKKFVIMDVIVQTANGEYINVEMQKIGYAFPVARADCYTADMIMRQYDHIKKQLSKEGKQKFRFSALSKVITVVIMEKSYHPFSADHSHDIHHRYSVFDTGIQVDGLVENYFVCLDIYREYLHTEVKTKKEAWMLFLGSQSVEHILEVCDVFPEFTPLYERFFSYRKEVSDMADIYYEALQLMNHNTELYMIEEMQKEMQKEMQEKLAKKDAAIAQLQEDNLQQELEIQRLREQLMVLQKK
jgi:hypothetical protein